VYSFEFFFGGNHDQLNVSLFTKTKLSQSFPAAAHKGCISSSTRTLAASAQKQKEPLH